MREIQVVKHIDSVGNLIATGYKTFSYHDKKFVYGPSGSATAAVADAALLRHWFPTEVM